MAEGAEASHDYSSVGEGPVEPNEDVVAVADPYQGQPPESAVTHLDPAHIRETMISQSRELAAQACKTEVLEIRQLLQLLGQLKYPEDRFTAFLRRTSEGSENLLEILEAGPSEAGREARSHCFGCRRLWAHG